MEVIIGIEKGEVCNRYGCTGIIDEIEKGGCSCHINPPCSSCTEPRAFCGICGWSDAEEARENENKCTKVNYKPIFKIRTLKDLDGSKIDYISRSHTHFSMLKEGVFPIGTPVKDLVEKIKGTFGGRFLSLTETTFKYVAYTD